MEQAMTVMRRSDGEVVCDTCVVANTPLFRMRGLLGRYRLPPGEGLLLRPASAIHMAFMRFSIDAVFLDQEGTVVKIVANLRPWRAAAARGARSVLELPEGDCARSGIQVGERLVLEPHRC